MFTPENMNTEQPITRRTALFNAIAATLLGLPLPNNKYNNALELYKHNQINKQQMLDAMQYPNKQQIDRRMYGSDER
jgi:hypothetical protein